MLNKKDVVEHFGTHGYSHGQTVLGRLVQIHDLLNGLTVWGDICSIKSSEETIIASQVSRLAPDSITIFDRGFPGYGLMYLMINEETPRHFIIRCSVKFNKEVIAFCRSSKRSKIVELKPSYKSITMLKQHHYIVSTKTTIKVRMVQINLPNGEQEIMLTNLYNEKLYSIEDLKWLYSLRWGIETAYNKLKNQQQLEQFSGTRVICIQQDLAASLFVANLQSLIEKQSDKYLRQVSEKRKYQYQINRNLSWAAMKNNIIQLFLREITIEILLWLQKKFEQYLEPVRPGRSYPRLKKVRRLTGKYQTFTNYKRAV